MKVYKDPKFVRRRAFILCPILFVLGSVMMIATLNLYEKQQNAETVSQQAVNWQWGTLGLLAFLLSMACVVVTALLIGDLIRLKQRVSRREQAQVYPLPVNRSHGGRG